MTQDPKSLVLTFIDRAVKAGASDADARFDQGEGVSVEVREGKLENIERDEGSSISLRCFVGQRQAHVSGSDMSADGLEVLVERCVAMAKLAPEDPYCGLTPPEDLASDWPELELDGDGMVSPETLEAEALEAEAAGLGVAGVKQVMSAGSGWSRGKAYLAASNGFYAEKSGGSSSIGLAAIAEQDGQMERDYDSWTVRMRANRPAPDEIGRSAGERAVARIGSRKIESCTAPVIYDRRVSASLLGALLSAISGPSIARGISYLKDRMGEAIFSDQVTITDDPFRPLGLGSRAFDGEGRPVSETHLIDKGVLTTWLLNGPSAKQLGLSPNGFASSGFGDPPGVRTSNLFMAPGALDQSGLMKEAGNGLLVKEMFGPSINPNTGDYSVGVSGVWFENGEAAYPVSEVTIAGALPDMFARLIPGSDLEFRGSSNAPSILVDGMAIGGV